MKKNNAHIKKMIVAAVGAALLAGTFAFVANGQSFPDVDAPENDLMPPTASIAATAPLFEAPTEIDTLFVDSVSSSTGAGAAPEILADNPYIQIVNPSGTIMLDPPPSSIPWCSQFSTENAATGTPIVCPIPAMLTTSTYNPYRIEVVSSTQLLFADRTPAPLSAFQPGDEIDVFGLYNMADSSMTALIIRDLSKTAPSTLPALRTIPTDLQNVLAAP